MHLWRRLGDARLFTGGSIRNDGGGEQLQLAIITAIAAILILSLASPIGFGMLGLFRSVLERIPS
jgi:hypothetical protein